MHNTIRIFDTHAAAYNDKFMDLSLYHAMLDALLLHLKPAANILDVACGPGNITRYLLGKRPDLKVLGVDLSPNMIDLAIRNNPNADFRLLDCRNIASLGRSFDAIVCGFGLPYLNKKEAVTFINSCATALVKGGMLYLSTMEGDNDMSGYHKRENSDEQLYVNYHEAGYLCAALDDNGFKLLDIQRIKYPDGQKPESIDLVLLAVKK